MKAMKGLHRAQMEHCECDAHEEAREEHARLHIDVDRLRTALGPAVFRYAGHDIECPARLHDRQRDSLASCDCGFTDWVAYARAALGEKPGRAAASDHPRSTV